MKTLHLTNAWHATSGGVSTFYRALADAAAKSRHHVRLIVPSESDSVEDINASARIYHLRSPRAPLNRNYRILLPHRLFLPGSAGHRILRDERPDVVEVCDKYTLNYVASLLRRGWIPGVGHRPAVIGMSCERMDVDVRAYLTRSALGEFLARWYMKWLYFPLFDHHIAVSEHTSRELLEAARGHRVRRGGWIRSMGVDATLFSPRRRSAAGRRLLLRQAVGREETILLLYAGRLVREKNLPLLIGLMERLIEDRGRDFHLLVAGDGALRPEFERNCGARLPGHVTFLGHIANRERLAEIYANADLFVHPNPNEPFGIAPLEAMASGTPLLAPRTGGVSAYAHTGNAWLADATADAFAAAAADCLIDPSRRAAKVQAARRTAEEHSWESVAARFFELCRELHAVSTGVKTEPAIPPAFASTSGNWLGMEI